MADPVILKVFLGIKKTNELDVCFCFFHFYLTKYFVKYLHFN